MNSLFPERSAFEKVNGYQSLAPKDDEITRLMAERVSRYQEQAKAYEDFREELLGIQRSLEDKDYEDAYTMVENLMQKIESLL